ncbi:MAG: tyrosinase family protein [Rhizomicrobium sp.]
MSHFSRRRVLSTGAAGLAASAIPLTLFGEMGAEAGPPLVRYEASTPNGQAMLTKYSQAVAIMKSKALGDPCSWTFQANTHWVRSDTTKAALVATLPAAQQPLANDMWNTCQNHGGLTTEDMFLPWHRMYVYYLEKIVRMVLNDNTFTLPYWNYNAAATAAMPNKFINPGNAGNPLYRAQRNAGPQSGAPLTGLDLSALGQTTYSGFCSTLDFGLHGNVHVKVGNGQGMGAVPWAANDPIFWMHHCNIDRLWASWNAAGRTNPTTASWLNQTFVFANPGYAGCTKIVATVGNFKAIAPLGYAYDRLEPVPGALHIKWPFLLLESVRPFLLKGPGPVELSPGATHVQLATAGLESVPQKGPLLSTRLKALTADKRIYLLLDGLMADSQPGVTYSVYLNPPGASPNAPDKSLRVGTINFFGAVMPGGGRMKDPPKQAFDVTDLLRGLERKGPLSDKVSVSVVPDGEADAKARPMVGSLSLAEV